MASEEIIQSASPFSNQDSVQYTAKTYHQNFTSRLVTFREKERFTDIKLKCKDLEVPCHRVVLAAASSYFNTMFCSGMKESAAEVVEMKSFNQTF